MRRATTDEDRRPAIAVTSRAAPLLAIELLAGALHIAAFAGGTGRTTALFELPGHDAVQDVGAGVDTEDIDVQIDVGAGFTGAQVVKGLNLDLPDQDSCAHSVAPRSTTVSSPGL